MTARGPLSLVKTGTLAEHDAVQAARPALKASRKVPPWQDKAKGNKGDVSARRSLHTFSFSCQAIAQQTKIPMAKPAAESGVPRASIAIELPSPQQDLGRHPAGPKFHSEGRLQTAGLPLPRPRASFWWGGGNGRTSACSTAWDMGHTAPLGCGRAFIC